MNKMFDPPRWMTVIMGLTFLLGTAPLALADVYINVMAVNGMPETKESPIKFNLPGDITAQDILDTNGLDLDYNVNDANYYVHGKVTLKPKESKIFRIRVRDVWRLTPQHVNDIKNKIEQGYEQIGKLKDPQAGGLLRNRLLEKLDFVQAQSTKADSVEKRMDAFRAYTKELQRIEYNALAVDYWRSDPHAVAQDKIIRFNIEIENPFDTEKPYKHKHYLPAEVKPENLVEFEGFEVRFDQARGQVFLFKEEQLKAKEKKKYTIGVKDVWLIPSKDINDLHSRANDVYDFLKDSKFDSSAKTLFDHMNVLLADIEASQAQKRGVMEHISIFRNNQKTYDSAKADVENLEKLLSMYREGIEKTRVQNILQKVRSLRGPADIAKAVFHKKPTETTTWKLIKWILVFVAFLTILNFVVWMIRSKEKKTPGTQSPGEKIA
ncbi:MAG: hypothetical protein HY209_05350 [Candidatus Omnitrophica bacterium]|nr:hypothetical protein [Candidatus Omnitrophota bacterium]